MESELGQITEVQTGPFGSQLHKEDYVINGTPIVTVEHLGKREFTTQNLPRVSETDRMRLQKYILHTGDIVFSRVGAIDRCSYVSESENGWMFSGRCLRIRPDNSIINSKYLYYYLTTSEIKDYIRNIAVGATMPSINTTLLSKVIIKYPNIYEQDAIASTLSCLDDKIEINNKINANLEAQAQAIFKNWFVDFEPFRDGEFVESELGMIPKGWSIDTLDSYCNLIGRGITPKYDEDSDKLVINQKCVRDNKLDLSFARKHKPKETMSKWLEYGDILINSTGTGTLGRMAQVWFPPKNLTVDSHITIVRPKNSVLAAYLGANLCCKQSIFESMSTGSTGQTELSRDRLKNMLLLTPPDDILEKFFECFIPYQNMIIANQTQSRTLTTICDALLPKLMSGEIKVPIDKEYIYEEDLK